MSKAIRGVVTSGLVLATFGLAGGCTAMRGDSQKVKFESKPEVVEVMLNDEKRKTPFEEELKRKQKYVVVASAAGYQSVRFEFFGRVDTAAAIPIALPLGSVMMATDMATGANKDFSGKVTIVLEPLDPGESAGQPVEMKEWRGILYTPAAYDAKIKAELDAIKASQRRSDKQVAPRK
jgi:hypothetical protein